LSKQHRVTLVPGDGIGPSISDAAVSVISAAGVKIDWEIFDAGQTAIDKGQESLSRELLDSVAKNRVLLKGPITTPIGTGIRSANVGLRKHFDLFANVRPCVAFEGVDTPFQGTDIVVIRENTEGLYTGVESYVDEEKSAAVISATNTRVAMERICRYGFEWARRNGRKKVACVHKANILKIFSGIFLESFCKVSKERVSGYGGRRENCGCSLHGTRSETAQF
jgi:isocitrate dehydrogenase (NAD+)